MMLNLIPGFSARRLAGLLTVLTALTLSACGGGNGSAGTPLGEGKGTGTGTTTVATAVGTISLSLVSNASCPASVVTSTCPLTATAVLKDSAGKPVADQVVTFANSLTLTVLAPTAGTVLTDATGTATVQVAIAGTGVNQTGTAGTITVSATVGTATVTNSKNYSLGNSAVTLAFASPATSPFNLNAYGSTTVAVNVSSGGTLYTAQPVAVTFTSTCVAAGKATLPATASTINGQAVVTYTDAGCGQSDTITASVSGAQSVNTTIIDAQPGVGSINFVSAVPSDASIVFLGSGGSGRVSVATLTFEVVDTNGHPLSGVPVSFSDNNLTVSTLGNSSGLTGSNGQVSTTVNAVGPTGSPPVYPAAGTLAVTAVAQVSSTVSVTAISSNVVVSTGVPVQAAMSMVPASHNIEGADYFGTTTSISFFLSDSNGNPVVDGTPVAATTNEGGVSGATGSSPGCTTLNGQCKLTFTTQNPATDVLGGVTQYGIATITGTSTNNTTTPLSSTITVYMSGSVPYFYYYNGSHFVWTEGTTFDFSGSCSGTLALWLSDEYGNPMAKSTSIGVAAVTTGFAVGTYAPTAVPDDGRYLAGDATVANPSANLLNYASLPLNSLTHVLNFNANIFATEISIPFTAPNTCGSGTTPTTGQIQVTIGDPASKGSYVATFGITYLD